MPKFGSIRSGGASMTRTTTSFTGSGKLGGSKSKSVSSKNSGRKITSKPQVKKPGAKLPKNVSEK